MSSCLCICIERRRVGSREHTLCYDEVRDREAKYSVRCFMKSAHFSVRAPMKFIVLCTEPPRAYVSERQRPRQLVAQCACRTRWVYECFRKASDTKTFVCGYNTHAVIQSRCSQTNANGPRDRDSIIFNWDVNVIYRLFVNYKLNLFICRTIR